MTQLVKSNPTSIAEFTPEQVDLIKRTIAPSATNDELKMFLHHAHKAGLDPLAKQIYFQKYGSKMTIIVSIDGYRLIAERTGCYAGSDDPVFDDEKNPTKATVTVYKMVAGVRCPFTATARWDEYCPPSGRDHMWQKMGFTMLAKCAEGLALRKGFPAELSGLYTKEEMDQAEPAVLAAANETIDAETGEVKPKIPERIQKVLTSFEEIGIDQAQLEDYLGKPLVSAEEKEIELLRALYYQHKPGAKK